MIKNNRFFLPNLQGHKVLELGLCLLVGILSGALVVITPNLPVPSDWQKLVLLIPFAFAVVMIFNNMEKLILAGIAFGIVTNLDFSLIISPYARNLENVGVGNRTIVALTELRLSLILILVVIGYAFWLIERQNIGRQPIRFFASTSIPALGLIFFSIISIFQAQNLQLSFFRTVQLVELFLVYLYLANRIRTKQDIQFFINVLMWGMLAESILMIVQWRTGWNFSFAGISTNIGRDLRATGTLGPADSAGGIIAAYLAIVSAIAMLFPRRSQKVFAGICFVAGCIALITTGSRTAWVSLVVALFVFILVGLWRGWVRHQTLIWLFTMALVIGGIFYPVVSNRLTADDRGSAASRLKMFKLAWNVISASPSHLFLGVGANNYALIAPAYYTSDVGDLGYVIDSSVHNAYLLTWAETGLFGLLFFLGLLAASLTIAWKHIQSGNRFDSLMALGLGCAILAMSIQMLAYTFIPRSITYFLWLSVALITCLDNIRTLQDRPPSPTCNQ